MKNGDIGQPALQSTVYESEGGSADRAQKRRSIRETVGISERDRGVRFLKEGRKRSCQVMEKGHRSIHFQVGTDILPHGVQEQQWAMISGRQGGGEDGVVRSGKRNQVVE